jgi:ABC-type transport system involved in multi-copper enzyme maturation permease subunit
MPDRHFGERDGPGMTASGTSSLGANLIFGRMPVVQKELLEMAALRRTYVVRVVFASLLFVAMLYVLSTTQAFLTASPQGLLGSGRTLFEGFIYYLFAGICLFLPAMVAGAFPEERMRGTLPLLLLTGLPPWRIVAEKFVGRVVPMMTLILASFPLFALAYAFGGVTVNRLLSGLFLLALCSFQVGALGILVSSFTRTVGGAIVATYSAGLLLTFVSAVGVLPCWTLFGGRYFPFAPVLYVATTGNSFAEVLVESIPTVVVVALFLLAASRRLSAMGRAQTAGGSLPYTRPGAEPTPQAGSSRGRVALPDRNPVAWRDYWIHSPAGVSPVGVLLAYFLLMGALIALSSLFGQDDYRGRAAGPVQVFIHLVWGATVLVATQQAARSFVAERLSGTLELLLVTPLRGADIVRQKTTGVRRNLWVITGFLGGLCVVEAIWEAGTSNLGAIVYLALSLLCIAVYVPMLLYLSVWFGLKARSGGRAALAALATVAAWVFIPLPAGHFASEAFGDAVGNILLLLSPFTLMSWLESDAVPKPVWLAVAVNFSLYGFVLYRLRSICLDGADRRLGRVERQVDGR